MGFFLGNETKIAIIERHRTTNYQLTTEFIYTQPKQEGTKRNAQYHQSHQEKQHTKDALNLIIPKTTHYTDEAMLYRLGLKVGICVWPMDKMKGSQQRRRYAQRGLQRE